MRIVQRYLLRELITNALFTFVTLAAVIVMLFFSMAAMRAALAFLGPGTLLQIVGFQCLGQISIILPLTILVASIWTYSRAQREGEIDAMRGAGIPIFKLLMPALLLGAFCTLTLTILENEWVPRAEYHRRALARDFRLDNIDQLLLDGRRSFSDKRFDCSWADVKYDADGNPFLSDFYFADKKGAGKAPIITRARIAIPQISESKGELMLTLKDLRFSTEGASDSMTLRFDLSALSEDSGPSRKPKHMSYAQLMDLSSRLGDSKLGRRAHGDLHRRASGSVSAFCFALFGALLGLTKAFSNRIYVFTIGFLSVLVLSFTPTMIGSAVAKSGNWAAVPIYWFGPWVLTILGLVLYVKARRR